MKKSRVLLGFFFVLAVLSRQITGAAGAQVEIFNQELLNSIKVHAINPSPNSITDSELVIKSFHERLKGDDKKPKETVYKKYLAPDNISLSPTNLLFTTYSHHSTLSLSQQSSSFTPLDVRAQSPPSVATYRSHVSTRTHLEGFINCDSKQDNSGWRFCLHSSRT